MLLRGITAVKVRHLMPAAETADEDVVLEEGDAPQEGEQSALASPSGQGSQLGSLPLTHMQHS